jgi:hypothetical protein
VCHTSELMFVKVDKGLYNKMSCAGWCGIDLLSPPAVRPCNASHWATGCNICFFLFVSRMLMTQRIPRSPMRQLVVSLGENLARGPITFPAGPASPRPIGQDN